MTTTATSLPRIYLTAAHMGADATQDDFDDWAGYVMEHIDAAVGFHVFAVDQFPMGSGDVEDRVDGTAEQRDIILRWLAVDGWNAFCGTDAELGAAAGHQAPHGYDGNLPPPLVAFGDATITLGPVGAQALGLRPSPAVPASLASVQPATPADLVHALSKLADKYGTVAIMAAIANASYSCACRMEDVDPVKEALFAAVGCGIRSIVPTLVAAEENVDHVTVADGLDVDAECLADAEADATVKRIHLSAAPDHNHFGEVFLPKTCPACAAMADPEPTRVSVTAGTNAA